MASQFLTQKINFQTQKSKRVFTNPPEKENVWPKK